jgi:hypothetical protein
MSFGSTTARKLMLCAATIKENFLLWMVSARTVMSTWLKVSSKVESLNAQNTMAGSISLMDLLRAPLSAAAWRPIP